jgi:hypothetical protein
MGEGGRGHRAAATWWWSGGWGDTTAETKRRPRYLQDDEDKHEEMHEEYGHLEQELQVVSTDLEQDLQCLPPRQTLHLGHSISLASHRARTFWTCKS